VFSPRHRGAARCSRSDVRGTRGFLTFAPISERDRLQVAVLCEGLHDAVEVTPTLGIAV